MILVRVWYAAAMKHTTLALGMSLGLLFTGLPGCSTDRTHVVAHQDAAPPAGVARLGHLVFLSLKDPTDTAELIESSRAELRGIPGLTALGVGTPLETGRDAVDSDYDVALYLGFDTEDDYAAYLVHPAHVAYVEAWRSRFESIRIFDVLED